MLCLYYVKNLLKLWEWAYYVSATHTNVVETMHLYVVATKDYMTFWSERFWMSCNLSSLLIIVNMSLKLPYRRFNKISRLEWVNNVFTKLIITTHFLKKILKAYNIVFIFLIIIYMSFKKNRLTRFRLFNPFTTYTYIKYS